MANHVHPTAVIGAGVELGDGITIGPHAVLTGPLTIADDCWVGAGTVIGSPPEIRGADHLDSREARSPYVGITIGLGTVIRELTTVHQGSERVTIIGAACYVMNKCHVAHDVEVGDNVTLSAGMTMGGHVSIAAGANIGLGAILHQRRVIGAGAMVGMGSVVTKDIPPFALVHGAPCTLRQVNMVGMQRQGLSNESAELLSGYYSAATVPTDDQLPTETREEFAWWRERATRPLGTR